MFHRQPSLEENPQQQQHIIIDHGRRLHFAYSGELYVDLTFEIEEFDSTSVTTGDFGLFYPDNWLLLDGQIETYHSLVAAHEEAYPIFLNTAVRWKETDIGVNSEMISTSKVHDRHPFLGFLSWLENAQVYSAVYLSIPYLTDKYVIDQLCYYADPIHGRGLQIYTILGPQSMNQTFLKRFISDKKEAQIRTSLSRLHIKSFGIDDNTNESYFSHSNAMVSTAGTMIGSYNYTAKARLRHFEHAVLLDADCNATLLLCKELSARWEAIPSEDMVLFPAPTRQQPTGYITVNPYAKKQATLIKVIFKLVSDLKKLRLLNFNKIIQKFTKTSTKATGARSKNTRELFS